MSYANNRLYNGFTGYLAVMMCILLLWSLSAATLAATGYIDYKRFSVSGNPAQYQINTGLDIELTPYLQTALKNGVTLNVYAQFALGAHRSWWRNKHILLKTVHFQLKYHELSRHYLLNRMDTGEHWNFSLFSAVLAKLGEQRSYVMPKLSENILDGKHYFLANTVIAPATLRLPLRIQSYFSDRYSLSSEGLLWPLQ